MIPIDLTFLALQRLGNVALRFLLRIIPWLDHKWETSGLVASAASVVDRVSAEDFTHCPGNEIETKWLIVQNNPYIQHNSSSSMTVVAEITALGT